MRLTLQSLKAKGLELRLAPGVCEALSRRTWRGHVRELQAVLERAAIFSRGEIVASRPSSTTSLFLPRGGTPPRRRAACFN